MAEKHQKHSEAAANQRIFTRKISISKPFLSDLRVLLLAILTVITPTMAEPVPESKGHTDRNRLLYWINGPRIKDIITLPFRYVIIDYSADGTHEKAFTKEEIDRIRNSHPDRKLILAYLSIGESEDYRFYWQNDWKPDPSPGRWEGNPSFMGPENPKWKGNYIVNYADTTWQTIIQKYLDYIIDQNFDGVYLDLVDCYYNYQKPPYNGTPGRQEMEAFVIKLSQHAKKKNPDFRIFVQNAEELAEKENTNEPNLLYLNAIDGIGKESAFMMNGKKRTREDMEYTVRYLNIFKNHGKTVFTIDYPNLKNRDDINWLFDQAKQHNFIQYVAPRELDFPVIHPRTTQVYKRK